MARIMAFDIGIKRIGVAATDPLKIIATGIETVSANDIWIFIKEYMLKENVESVIVGNPKQMNYSDSESKPLVDAFVKKWKNIYPQIPIQLVDERFTSKIALQTMIQAGSTKKDRKDKSKLDTISAVILLQTYMQMTNG
jgi:putative holliday junction resolvase